MKLSVECLLSSSPPESGAEMMEEKGLLSSACVSGMCRGWNIIYYYYYTIPNDNIVN